MSDVEKIARALLAEMEYHGGVDAFAEKLTGHPEQYCTDLALAAFNTMAEIERQVE